MMILLLAAGIFFWDYSLKRKMEQTLAEGEERDLLHGKAKLCLLYNKGAVMGVLKEQRGILNTITVAVVTLLFFFVPGFQKKRGTLASVFMGLILGGALGNAYDRLLHGKVTDYIRFPKLPGKLCHIVFNLADFCLMFGGLGTIFTANETKK